MNRLRSTAGGRKGRALGALVVVLALILGSAAGAGAAPLRQPVIFGEGLLPVPFSTINAGAVVIGCTVNSALPIASYQLTVDDIPVATSISADGPPWQLRASVVLSAGPHRAGASVTDTAGQSGGWTWQFTVIGAPAQPTTPPTAAPTVQPNPPTPAPGLGPGVRALTPAADWLVPTGQQRIAVRFSTDTGWQSRMISLDDRALTVKSAGAAAGSEVLYADVLLTTGIHTAKAVGVDTLGRQATAEWSFLVSGPAGDTDPKITPLNPLPGQSLPSGNNVRLVALLESAANLQANTILLDGRALANEGGPDPHRATLMVDTSRVPAGRHIVRIQASDDAGHTTTFAWDFYVGLPASPAERLYYGQTGYSITGPFRQYWEGLGTNAVPVLGYPISGLLVEKLDDGKLYTVQYYERVRLEWHPENEGNEFEVLYGLLGTHFHKPDPAVARPAAKAGERFFPETGHLVRGAFLQKWNTTGGLRVHGYPISEEVREVSPTDGRVYLVQYFQRARFEYHPENVGTPFEILLGMLGRQLYAERNQGH